MRLTSFAVVLVAFASYCSGCHGQNSSVITPSVFDQMLLHCRDLGCPSAELYTYEPLMAATTSFPNFATTGDTTTQKREVAAFLALRFLDNGGHAKLPGYNDDDDIGESSDSEEEIDSNSDDDDGAVGSEMDDNAAEVIVDDSGENNRTQVAVGSDITQENPDEDMVDLDNPMKIALWLWMTPQCSKPSCHEVITGAWSPPSTDIGSTSSTNYILQGFELCADEYDVNLDDWFVLYKKFSDILEVSREDDEGNENTQRDDGVQEELLVSVV